MSGITLHVLNLITGLPAHGVPAVLELRTSSRTWHPLGQGSTNEDGRIENILPKGFRVQPGTYRLTFEVTTYFRSHSITSFYPEIVIVFGIRDATAHHHIPLLLGPFGYTTYRGS